MQKVALLQQFIEALFELDPMGLAKIGAPSDEYECEALSVLSRFNEGALYLCEDKALRLELARNIVATAFEFWFNTPLVDKLEVTAARLLEVFESAYPEQAPREEARSEP